jgi:O-antigen/teichoic acid export membrane protein
MKLSGKGKLLAYWQVLAGAVSLIITVLNVPKPGFMPVGVALLAVAVLSLAAGILLLRGKPSGIGLSWVTQLAQLPALYLKGLHVQVFLLLSLDVGKHASGNFFLNWHAGSGAFLRVGEVPFQFAGVNLVALIFCIFLALGAFNKER